MKIIVSLPYSINIRTTGFLRKSALIFSLLGCLLAGQAKAGISTVNTSGTNLSISTNYTPNGLPSSTTDILFDSGSAYAGSYSVGTASTNGTLNLRSLNFLNTGVTIVGLASSTTALNFTGSGGDSVGGANPADVIYVSTGSQTITSAATKIVSITLSGTGGNFDIGSGAYLNSTAIISGTGGLNKTGNGTLILNATESYTGNTTITSGTLQVGAGSTTGVLSAGTVTDNASLVFNRSNAYAVGTTVIFAGTGAIYQVGTGTTFLAGNSTFSGTTFVNSGGFVLGNSTAGGSTAGAINGDIVNNAFLGFNRSNTGTFAGTISGSGAVTNTGTGTMILTGTNTYTGATTVAAGTLEASATNTLNFAKATVNSGATLAISASTSNNSTTWSTAAITTLLSTATFSAGSQLGFDVVSGGTYTYGTDIGPLNHAGTGLGLNKLGAGFMLLTGTETYTGNTTASAGILELSSANTVNMSHVVANSGATLAVSASTALNSTTWTPGAVTTLLNTGTLNTGSQLGLDIGSGTFTYATDIGTDNAAGNGLGLNVLGGGTLILSSGSSSYTGATGLSGGATLVVNGGTFTGLISDSGTAFPGGSLVVNGPNTTVLVANESYTGTTTINSGTLQLGNGGATGAFANGVAVVDNGTLTINKSGATAVNQLITGTGGVIIMGTGTATFSGNLNTYTGTTVIMAGASMALGNTGGQGILDNNSAILDNGALLFTRSGSLLYSNVISGSGSVSLINAASGTMYFTGANTYTGTTTIAAGTTANGNVLRLGNGGTTGSIVSNVVDNSTLSFDRSDLYTFSNTISGTGAVTQIGTGTTVLTGTNTYTGATTVSAGVLEASSTATLPGYSKVTVNAGGAFAVNVSTPSNVTTWNTATINSLLSTGTFNANSALGLDVASGTYTFGSNLGTTNAGMGLNKMGAGLLILNAANTNTGTTTISGGALQLGDGTTMGSVAGAVVDNGSLVLNTTGSTSLAGLISGTGSLTVGGTGTVTLGNNNTFTGGSTVNGGTIIMGNAGAFVVGGSLTMNGGTIDTLNTSLSIGSLNGTGGIVTNNGVGSNNLTIDGASSTGTATWGGSFQQGASILNLFFGAAGANYTQLLTGSSNQGGSISIVSGTVLLGNSYALNVNRITLGPTAGNADNHTVLAATGTGGFTFQNPFTISGSGNSFADTGVNTIGGLNTSGTDTWIGNVTIGTTNSTSMVTGTLANPLHVHAEAGGTQLYNGIWQSGTNLGGSLNAVVQIEGGGNVIFAGNNTYTGTTVVNGSTLQLGNGSNSGGIVTGVVLSDANAVLAFNRSDSYNFANTISGSGGVTQMGSGTTTLSVANTYTGATTVSAGTLLVTSTSGAGMGAVNLSGGTLNVNTGVPAGLANSSVTFTNAASSYILQRAAGNSYNVYAASSDLQVSDVMNTNASIRDGAASGTTSVTTSFRTIAVATNDSKRVSDVFSLAGTAPDTITLQLDLNASIDGGSFLASLDGGTWVNTIMLNSGAGTLAGFYAMSYDAFLAANGGSFDATAMLGAYGVDASNGAVWAVINHNSDFAILAPEPQTYALFALGLGVILIVRRRRQAA